MRFYEIKGVITNPEWAETMERTAVGRQSRREKERELALAGEAYNRSRKGELFCTPVAVEDVDFEAVMILCEGTPEKRTAEYLKKLGLTLSGMALEEITFHHCRDLLRHAARAGFIEDEDDVLEYFQLGCLCDNRSEFGENILENAGKAELYHKAEQILAGQCLKEELDRIYAGRTGKKATGHPVHYLVQTDDRNTRKTMYRTLLEALYGNGRIQNRRYCFLDFGMDGEGWDWSPMAYDSLYQSCVGGTVVVRCNLQSEREDGCASPARDLLEMLCAAMRHYSNRVLTLFCLPRECSEIKSILYENLGEISLVELREDTVPAERAEEYLKYLAKENGVRPDKKLRELLEKDHCYLAPELREMFDTWYNAKLKTEIYPQYKDLLSARKEIQKAPPKGNAYEELMEMVGLTEAKRVIQQALAYHKAQKLFADQGMRQERTSMHMVFTGNPGTAKTTVARLFARILKENGILSRGKLIEVGRGDLVGKYVGWTAPTIQKKFKEAEGSVLFIDEAYSLVDDRSGSFGDEAINTIVQEMENHRDSVVVIFAGYPDQMEQFLRKNPGLRSRIAWHVPFADYTPEELCSIANLIAKQQGLKLSEDAQTKLAKTFAAAAIQPDFGNGRFVRNILEKARMAQAVRLLELDCDRVGKEDICRICGEDIVLTDFKPAEPHHRPIGF